MMLRLGTLDEIEMEPDERTTLLPTLPPPTLEELLDCKPSHLLYKINNDKETVSVSDLKQKLVGLYLCVSGGVCLNELACLHHACKAQGLELEIVIVYIPFLRRKDEVESLQGCISVNLAKKNICDWWVSPFRDMVSRRLWRTYGLNSADGFIVVGPNGKFVERCGRAFQNYPFSKEVYVDRHVARLRELTLESLLTVSKDQIRNDGAQVPVAELRGRNILFYIGPFVTSPLYVQLCDWYPRIKSKDPGFEVVYIPGFENLACDGEPFGSMEWLGFPWDPKHVLEQLFLKAFNRFMTLITFGPDGKIRAIDATEGTVHDAFRPQDLRKVLLGRLERELEEANDDLLSY